MDQVTPLGLDFETARKAAGITVAELSARTNIPKTSLIRYLRDPSLARVGQWAAIALELDAWL